MQLVTEWEKENNMDYPHWATVWHYDAYGESWMPEQWSNVKDFYTNERKQKLPEHSPMWQFYYEPYVALPTDTPPEWGAGIPLKRITTDSV
jgi:hypothetical protein